MGPTFYFYFYFYFSLFTFHFLLFTLLFTFYFYFLFAKLSPSPSFNFNLGLRWLYFQLLQAGRPFRVVLSKHNTALLSKVKLFNLTSRMNHVLNLISQEAI